MAVVFGLLGVLVGGLMSQLASDVMARRGLTAPHCPRCGEQRPLRQWISSLSLLIRRHRCMSCGAELPGRGYLAELGLGVTYSYLWLRFGPSVTLILYLLYSSVFMVVLITDIERRLIPNAVMYPSILIAVGSSLINPGLSLPSSLAGGLSGFLFFLAAALVGNAMFGSGALGGGDVKLAAFVGLITGFPSVIDTILLTILIGGAVSVALLVTRVRSLHDHIPYGPFLVAGTAVTLLSDVSILGSLLRR
jgi:leader peptidase (prepilin peptidase)/N-methyltransferase